MTPEKWQKIMGNAEDNFEVSERGTDHIDDQGGVDVEFIEFIGPLGKMKLEFVTKPILLDKKTSYSHRAGSDIGVEYVYSPDEKSHKLMAYKWDEDSESWVEIDSDNFS